MTSHELRTRKVNVGFLTYDVQPFTEDCLDRVDQALEGATITAYPVIAHPNQDNARFRVVPSRQKGRYFGVEIDQSTPEGFAYNVNWTAAWRCVSESEIVVLFGLQGATAMLTALLALLFRRPMLSVNQTLPIAWEKRRRWWVRLCKRWLLARCSLHISQSKATREVLTSLYGIGSNRLIDAPFEAGAQLFCQTLSTVSSTRDEIRTQLALPNCPLFLFVGNLHPFKGVKVLLQAVARVSKVTPLFCVLAGPEEPANREGGTIDGYLELARSLAVEGRVRFTGRLTMEALARLYVASDTIVLPTYRDMFPKVLVEGDSRRSR